MNKENDKIQAIITELVSYSLQNGSTSIDIRLKSQNKNNIIEITFNHLSNSSDIINELKRNFNIPRTIDEEEYYWRILGANNDNNSLYIVGIMINSFTLEHDEASAIKVTLYRKK